MHALHDTAAREPLTACFVDPLQPPRLRQAAALARRGTLCGCARCVGPFVAGVGQARLWSIAASSDASHSSAGSDASKAQSRWVLQQGMGDLTDPAGVDTSSPTAQNIAKAQGLLAAVRAEMQRAQAKESGSNAGDDAGAKKQRSVKGSGGKKRLAAKAASTTEAPPAFLTVREGENAHDEAQEVTQGQQLEKEGRHTPKQIPHHMRRLQVRCALATVATTLSDTSAAAYVFWQP